MPFRLFRSPPTWAPRAAALVLVAGAMVAAQQAGLLELFSAPARLREGLLELGPWGYVAFVVTYALLQPFGVPGTVFVWAAPLIWPWPRAFAASMVGTMAASVVGFSFARFIARDWVSARIPLRFRAWNAALEERGFATVFVLRFIFWMPQMLHAFFGVSRVRFWTHFWGSAAGYVVPLLAVSYFGERAFEALRDASPQTWVAIGALTTAALLLAWRLRRGRPPV